MKFDTLLDNLKGQVVEHVYNKDGHITLWFGKNKFGTAMLRIDNRSDRITVKGV